MTAILSLVALVTYAYLFPIAMELGLAPPMTSASSTNSPNNKPVFNVAFTLFEFKSIQ